jgi:hypothetical protein
MNKLLPARLAFLNPFLVNDLVRYGKDGDGGYLVPDSIIKQIDAVLSFGLATDWSFEEQLSRLRENIPIHVYDHTVGSKTYYRSAKNAFTKLLVGRTTFRDLQNRLRTYSGYKHFFVEPRRHYRQRIFNREDNPNDATLDIAFNRLGNARHVLLKMDIEGAEYRLIPILPRFAERIDLLAIEFHETEPLRFVFESAMQSLLEQFVIVHLHANNIAGIASDGLPEALEVTLVNKRHSVIGARRDSLPIPELDQPNDPLRPDYRLRFV